MEKRTWLLVVFDIEKGPVFWHYSGLPFMFDWSLDPRSQVALLCLFTAFAFWNNDALFFLFAMMAVCTQVARRST